MSLDEKQKDKTELKVSSEEEPLDASAEGADALNGGASVSDVGASERADVEASERSELATSEQLHMAAPVESTESELSVDAAKVVELPDLGPNYEALEVLGHGGMGAVYKVRDRATGATFAVKLLQKGLTEDPVALKRFEQEVSSASKLTHPNLVSVYGHGKTPTGAPYLVMDFLDGYSLSDVLEKEGRLEPKRALDIFVQIAEALKHAHDKGVIHRDVKPTNVILTKTESGAEIVRIVDFGIAKVLPATSRETRDLTQTGEVFGSPHYMSPEQCLGFMLDQRSDIYSFGCLMYEVITGEPPFGGSNPIQLVVKHINESPPDFQKELKTNRQIKLLETVILKCLDKEQNERFQTVDELKRDLESIRDDRPIAKYVNKRAKPTLTRQQLIGAVGLSFLIFYYAGTASSAVSSQTTSMVMGGMLTLVAGAGTYIFLKAGVARLSSAYRRRETPGRWWVAIILTSIGMSALSLLPWTIRMGLYDFATTPPLEVDVLCTAGTMFHEIFLLITVVSSICFVVTRSARRVGSGYIALWFAGIAVAIISWSLILIPNKLANIPVSIGTSLTQQMPDMAIPFYKAAANLDPTDRRWWELVNLQDRINDLQGGLESLKNLREERTDKGALSVGVRTEKVDLLMRLGRFDEALSVIRSIEKDVLPTSNRARGLLVKWYAKQGMYEKALGEIEKWESDSKKFDKGRIDSYENLDMYKFDIYLAMGQYQKALDSPTLECKSDDSYQNARANFLQGVLLGKLNQPEEAKKRFKDVLKGLNAYIDNHERLGNRYGSGAMLVISYAYAALGDMEKAKEFLRHAYNSDISRYRVDEKFFGRTLPEAFRHRLADFSSVSFAEKQLPLPIEFSP